MEFSFTWDATSFRLHTVTEYYRLDRKAPVTAALVAANTIIYLRPTFLHSILPTINQVWFNPQLILKTLLFSVVLADHKANSFPELHVLVFGRSCVILFCYYLINTYFDFACAAQGPETILPVSILPFEWFSLILQYAHFCGRGFNWRHQSEVQNLHRRLQALVAMSQGITLLPAKSLLLFFNYERPYYQEYAVGFSGVLFAMKIILNAQSDNDTYVHGLLVPTRYAAWAELILIQMFVPGVSFLGHLGGILAGLLFLCLKASYSGANPLRTIIRGFGHALNWPLRFMNCLFRRQRIGCRGTVGGRQTRDTSQMWRCQGCTFDNSGWLNVCEMCSTSRTDDVLSSLSSTDEVQDLSLDE